MPRSQNRVKCVGILTQRVRFFKPSQKLEKAAKSTQRPQFPQKIELMGKELSILCFLFTKPTAQLKYIRITVGVTC